MSTTGQRSASARAIEGSHESDTATVVGPRDCAIAFGIPTCQKGFEGRRQYGTSDYILPPRFSGWPEYEWRFVRFLTELEPGLLEVGVTVARDVTSRDFADLFNRHRVVVLFSHWIDEDPHFPLGAVELHEGPVDVDTIVDAIPQDYDGFLDLCVCHPKNLAGALGHARPRCRVKRLDAKAEPDFWLYFYGTLFRRLHEKPTSYSRALVQTRAELIGETRDGETL